LKYALFLGCFIPVRLPHIEMTARRVLPDFGIELVDLDGFTCCPEPIGFLTDKMTALSIATRNISIAEEQGLEIITLCNGCTYTLRQADAILSQDTALRSKINDVLSETGHKFRGSTKVKHFAQVLYDEVGVDSIRAKVKRPLEGLKVACHTGCHILSPPEIMDFGDPFDPTKLEELVSALGADPVDWENKTMCCGWTLTNYGNKESSNNLIDFKISSMSAASADCSTVICPQCFYQFDMGQMLASRDLKTDYRVPTTFYLQLLSLALGYDYDFAKFDAHRVKDPNLEQKLRRLTS
jgi:heterodisulfide reductase subunit B